MPLQVSAEREGEDLRIELDGEMDVHTCSELGAEFRRQTDDAPASRVVVDAAGLRFLDSSGISELLRVQQAVTGAGGTFELAHATPTVRRVVEITGLVEVLGLR